MIDLQNYHDNVWLPFSASIDKKVKPYKILRVLKKLFDVHFTILGVLGIIATPPNDIDCWVYFFKRNKPHKYQALGWKMRLKIIRALFQEVWRA